MERFLISLASMNLVMLARSSSLLVASFLYLGVCQATNKLVAHHVVHVAVVLEARGVGTLDGEVTDSPLTMKSGCKTFCSLLAVLAHPKKETKLTSLFWALTASFSMADIKAGSV